MQNHGSSLQNVMKYIKGDLTKDFIPKTCPVVEWITKWMDITENFNQLELNLSEGPSLLKN